MIIYTSIRKTEFNNVLACALDNQTDKNVFRELFAFTLEYDIESTTEWCEKRNFNFDLQYIVETLESIHVLK